MAICKDLETALYSWREALPPELSAETIHHWSHQNIWVLILRAMSYRLECLLYRKVRRLHGVGCDHLTLRTLQKQQNAMLELDTILDRIIIHDLVSCCPLSM